MHNTILFRHLNKALITLLVLCCFSNFIFSQDVYSNKESSTFSFTLGLTSSNLYHDTIRYSTGILFNGGFVYTLTFSDKINFGLEALLTGKAIKKDNPIIKYRFGYIDIPLYLQYKFNPTVRANIGLVFSKNFYSRLAYLDGSKTSGVHLKSFQSPIDNDCGILLGIELNLAKDVFIAARYSLSATSMLNSNKPYFGVFQLSFNYVAFRSYKQIFHKKTD